MYDYPYFIGLLLFIIIEMVFGKWISALATFFSLMKLPVFVSKSYKFPLCFLLLWILKISPLFFSLNTNRFFLSIFKCLYVLNNMYIQYLPKFLDSLISFAGNINSWRSHVNQFFNCINVERFCLTLIFHCITLISHYYLHRTFWAIFLNLLDPEI